MSAYGKKAHLTAAIHNWGPLYEAKVQSVLDGTWKSEDLWPGIAEGVTDLAPLHADIPADVKALVAEKKQAIKDGKMRVFDGPVFDQAGKEVIGAGETLDDGALKGFNWYVSGVEGKLPKS
jgi:simple sugar transport system substrate-binding protein